MTDCNNDAPALYRADKYYIVPKIKASNYLSVLFEICNRERINAVLPLQEDELVFIANKKSKCIEKGILPIISEIEVINLCRDKYKFYEKLQEIGVTTIPTYMAKDKKKAIEMHDFPLFMKPRFGAGSVSSIKIN